MLRIQMLHQHEPHARVEWQTFQQLRECLQPTRGSSDANDRKVGLSAFAVPGLAGETRNSSLADLLIHGKYFPNKLCVRVIHAMKRPKNLHDVANLVTILLVVCSFR